MEEHIARTAIDLEAARALVYAAAELKGEYDRRPTSKHLRLETDTLVLEAELLSIRAVEAMYSRARETRLGKSVLTACLPLRHADPAQLWPFVADDAGSITKKIARYYLFE